MAVARKAPAKKATARRTSARKVPGSRPGDFVFPARRGPVPLPSIDDYHPSARWAAEFDDLREAQEADPALAEDGNFQSRAARILYRMIESGLPDEYRAGFADTVSVDEMGDLLGAWKKASGGVGPGE